MESHNPSLSHLAGDRDVGARCPLCQRHIISGELVTVCGACGSVHHGHCWNGSGGCGAYVCAPPRRALDAPPTRVLRISAQDLARSAAAPVAEFSEALEPPAPRRTSRLAIASLITALLGVPFFGLVTGLVAIILGGLAAGGIRTSRLKGTPLAVAGILLGILDVLGWTAVLIYFLARGQAPIPAEEFAPDLAALQDMPPALNRIMRANVLIKTHAGFLGREHLGSGVIVRANADGVLILTNRHVVDPEFQQEAAVDKAAPASLAVYLIDQVQRPGRVTWLAPGGIDLALVRVASLPPEARVARWQLGRPLRVGDPVVAIGNPFGLGWTYTQGSVSQFRLHQVGTHSVRLIQTQTALNPGNSGGGLYDHQGYLVGINTLAQDPRSGEGINFAITFDTLRDLAPAGLDLHRGSEEGP